MHIIILKYSVLIKFVPTNIIEPNRFIPIKKNAIAVSNGTHCIIMLHPVYYSKYSNAISWQ